MNYSNFSLEEWEIKLTKEFYEKYRVFADTLERLIERDKNIHLSHYKLHKILGKSLSYPLENYVQNVIQLT